MGRIFWIISSFSIALHFRLNFLRQRWDQKSFLLFAFWHGMEHKTGGVKLILWWQLNLFDILMADLDCKLLSINKLKTHKNSPFDVQRHFPSLFDQIYPWVIKSHCIPEKHKHKNTIFFSSFSASFVHFFSALHSLNNNGNQAINSLR